MKIALAEAGLHGAAALVKPALLYADRVTIYSPAASMLKSIERFAALKDPQARAAQALRTIKAVPQFSSQLNADPGTLEQLEAFLGLDPRLVRQLARGAGDSGAVEDIYGQLSKLSDIWESELPPAIEAVRETLGVGDLTIATAIGAVEVAELGQAEGSAVISGAVNAALGNAQSDQSSKLISSFVSRLVEILVDQRSFPLLDTSAIGLARGLEEESKVVLSAGAMRRGSEVATAVGFMGFLPYFPELPMDEVLDLRKRLQTPLSRFRAAIVQMSQEFQARPVDADFEREVEDAWRALVEPALNDIREALAEHGLLSEVASVALGDPRRLLAEAGGVFAAAHLPILSLSNLLAASGAMAVPVADVVGRALQGVREARRSARTNAFYFLHRVAEEARKAAR